MNISTNYDLSIFIDRSEKPFEVELPIIIPPYPLEKDVLESRGYILTNLFKYLASFYEIVKDARIDLGLQQTFYFPKKFTIDSYSDLLEKLSLDRRRILRKWTNKILKKYSLLENWETSINTLILTHHLPIPYSSVPISYYVPPTEEELAKEKERNKTLRTFTNTRNLTRSWGVVQHPAIYFNSKITPTSLIKWINNHKYLFSAFNKHLKKETSASSRMTIRTQRVGELALIIKWSGKKKWSEMEKTIDEWEKGSDYDDYWGSEGRPTAEDLRIAFKSYYLVMSNLNLGDSESL